MNPLAWLRRWDSRRRDRKHRPELTAFDACVAQLRPGDIAIDCGANVGRFTVPMAQAGAEVYAFEPNPDAYACLVRSTAAFPNVRTFQAALSPEPGPVKLYLHRYAEDDPVHFSVGSSLLGSKRSVSADRYVLVDGMRFTEFLGSLGDRRVRLLKMDIEGAEIEVLNELLDAGWHQRIDQAFIEVHDRQIPALAEPTRRLRERLGALGASHFRLDWR